MGKKILIGITILLISGLLAGWYLFTREAKYFGTSAFRAVPENVSVIIRIHRLGDYAARSLNNPILKAYSGFPGVASLYEQLSFVDSLFKVYPEVTKPLIDNDLTILFDGTEDHFRNLCLVELSGLAEKKALSAFVDDYFTRKGGVAEKVKVGGTELSCYSWKEREQLHNYTITFYRGLFMAGNREMVTEAVNRLETPETPGSSIFEKASKTATDNIDLNIYLNNKRLPGLSHQVFSENFWKRLEGSAPLADWSEIDLTQKNDEFLFNGFSFTSDSLNHYLGIFLHQQPDTFNLAGLFPAETSFFLGYVINNSGQFFRDYENLLRRNNQYEKYKNALDEINTLYGVELQKIVVDNLEGAAAMVFTRPDPVLPDENKFLVIRARSENRIEQAMIPLTIVPGSNRKSPKAGNFSLYKIDKETIFKIYKTPVNDFGLRIFGEVFSDVVTNYFTIYDNCLIMGASYESLGRFLRANVLQETLGNDKTYREFISGFSGRLNFFLWSSPGRSLPFFKETLNAGLYQSVENQITGFQKIESVAWQIGVENGMIYNMARLKYNPEAVHESAASVIWKSHLGNRVIIQPQFVINPSDKKRREIVLQDNDQNFVLVSNEGRVLWKIKLPGQIRSGIFQLDYFKDGKIQYFFSTDEALHMVDHEGNYIQNYPVALRSVATNGVSVADYDRNRDYRFFIACKDRKVYLYDKKGKIITDWLPPKTEHDVTQPVQFFRVATKDYIVFADKSRGYILDRKGKNRVTINGDIAYSRNSFTFVPGFGKNWARLVTSDLKGNIVTIGFDGSVKRFSTGVFSPEHYFIYDDFDSDKKRDYIFLDGDSLVVYDAAINQIFKKKFKNSINLPPELFTFPDNSRKIGIADTTENRIYLFNPDGSLCKGFPLEGNSRFTLGFSGSGYNQLNLITGTPDGYLNNYQVK